MDAENDDDDTDDFDLGPSPYAVRMGHDRQVVGIFVATDLDQLADLVDQCCDPSGTEYLRLGTGGLYVFGTTKAQWPSRSIDDDEGNPVDVVEEDASPLNGAELDDFWWRDIEQGEWFPLVWERALSKAAPSRRKLGPRR